MKKYFFYAVMFTLAAVTGTAQTPDFNPTDIVSIEEGPEFKSKNLLEDIIAVHDGFFYTYSKKYNVIKTAFNRDRYFLAKFTIDMEFVNEVELKPEYEGNKLDVESIFVQGGELYMFTSFLNKGQKKQYLFYQMLDKETLLPNGEPNKIAEIAGDSNKKLKAVGFDILRSEDRSKTLVYYDLPFEKEDNERYGLRLYDEDMNLSWSKEIELPYKDNQFSVKKKRLANNGDVYVAGQLWRNKEDREKGEVNYTYKIIELSNNGQELQDYDVSLDGRFVSNLYVRLNDQNELLCGGFYQNSGSNGADGSFFLKINRETKEITKKSFNEFDASFIMEDMGKRAKKKTEKRADKGKEIGITKLKIDRFVRRNDGGAIIIGERQWVEQRTRTDQNGRMTVYYVYHHHDIVVVNIDPDGNIAWNARIPKRQTTTNSNYGSSYLMAVVESSLFFVFNDHPENMLYNGDGKLYNMDFRKNYVAMVEVDSDGRVFRRTLFNEGKGKNMMVMPLSSEQITDTDVLLFSTRGKRKQFVTMTFKE